VYKATLNAVADVCKDGKAQGNVNKSEQGEGVFLATFKQTSITNSPHNEI